MKKALFLTSTCLLLGWGNPVEAHPAVHGVNSSGEVSESSLSHLENEATSDFEILAAEPTEDEVAAPAASEPFILETSNEQVEIELIDRGEKPRKKLRFKPTPGQTQAVTTLMDMDMSLRMNGNSLPSFQLPTIELTGTAEMTQVDKDGTSYLTYTYGEPRILDSDTDESGFGALLRPALESQFKQFANTKIKVVYDRQGLIQRTEIEFNGEQTPEVENMLKQLASSTTQSSGVLPKKSVGVGAKWSSPQKVSMQGIELAQTVTYELLERTDDQVKLAMDLDLESSSTSFSELTKLFPVPGGAEVDFNLTNLSGSGTMTMDLTQYFASNMDLTMDVSMQMKIPREDGEDFVMEMDMSSTVTVLPQS